MTIGNGQKRRTVFYLSDRTGITVEGLGNSLLTQFDGISWHRVSIPFVDSESKAQAAAEQINQAAQIDGCRPLVFSTLVKLEERRWIEAANGIFFDFFGTFVTRMEQELEQQSSHVIGRSHGLHDNTSYTKRISAINYTLSNDDGVSTKDFAEADIILVGVSRSGKTPTCLYLAMQYGISAANYPLTEEDMDSMSLPNVLKPFRHKLFGLTISAEHLHRIRQERRPNSRYASLVQCQQEVQWQESLYRREKIPSLDTTSTSIEEISVMIINQSGLKRKVYGD